MANPATDKLVQAYHHMMERVHQAFENTEKNALPTLKESVEKARETAVELEELTHDEAEKVAYYLKRDVRDAGHHLSETSQELADWLRFDIDRIEDQLLSLFSQVADRTRIEMAELQETLKEDPPYHSGEITGPGTLYCVSCNEAIHFHHTAHIPECPECGDNNFRRWPSQVDGRAAN